MTRSVSTMLGVGTLTGLTRLERAYLVYLAVGPSAYRGGKVNWVCQSLSQTVKTDDLIDLLAVGHYRSG
jgi:hypothetical protein